MKFLALSLGLALMPLGCSTKTSVPPTNVASASKLEAIVDQKDSKVSASLEAAEYANAQNPIGPAKTATAGAISVGRAYAGPATAEDRAQMMALVNKALTSKLQEAEQGWAKERADGTNLLARINSLERQVEAERVQAANDLKAKLKEAEDKANSERRKWIMILTIGIGSLGVAAGVATLLLGSQYPFLGPKAGFSAIGAGLTLIAVGIAINAIERLLDNHPWIVGTGVGCAVLLATIAAALIYSNHSHHKSTS